jgi:transposase
MTNAQSQITTEGLFLAIEVSEGKWRMAFKDLREDRQVEIEAWDMAGLARHVAKAKERFGLAADARVRSCYEAGRVGFSLHRFLESVRIENVVVDPASIEVNRRAKHRKTDRLDAEKLARMLVRYHVYGEVRCWQVCRVPTPEQEAARRLDREYERLKKERTGHVNRIKALVAQHGVRCSKVDELLPGSIRDWSGELLGPAWQEEIGRELERLGLIEKQLGELEKRMKEVLSSPQSPEDEMAAKLNEIASIGPVTATALAHQFFWRDFENRREVGAAAGLTSCPYDSGGMRVDQGISRSGHRRIRTLAVELAWMWLRWQPDSALSKWFNERFGPGSKRLRRIGIVALARKLLVALWKYLKWGTIPEGAVLKRAARPKAA